MIVVAGEALIDIVRTPDGSDSSVGGGPLNIAVGLARLDQSALLLTQIGDDDHGRQILAHLRDNDVEVVAPPNAGRVTSTATATLDDRGVASYDFAIDWSLPHQDLPRCDVLHVGSLGTALEPGRESVLDLVDQAWGRDVFVSYDPNLRGQFLGDREQAWRDLESLAERATLVKLSDEDVELVQPGADPDDIARSLLEADRTELVVVTRGAEGSVAYRHGLRVEVPTPPTDLVDTVGAGDSFMAAMLAILADGDAFSAYGEGLPGDEESLRRLLSGAAAAASITCSRRGANPPTRRELGAAWPS